jgi:hypothetical protein
MGIGGSESYICVGLEDGGSNLKFVFVGIRPKS